MTPEREAQIRAGSCLDRPDCIPDLLAEIDRLRSLTPRISEPSSKSEASDEGRVESGPIQFGDDWPGLFLRGDEAIPMGLVLRDHVAAVPLELLGSIDRNVLTDLATALLSCEQGRGLPRRSTPPSASGRDEGRVPRTRPHGAILTALAAMARHECEGDRFGGDHLRELVPAAKREMDVLARGGPPPTALADEGLLREVEEVLLAVAEDLVNLHTRAWKAIDRAIAAGFNLPLSERLDIASHDLDRAQRIIDRIRTERGGAR